MSRIGTNSTGRWRKRARLLVFDTNILIYALDEGAALHEACLSRLERARRGYEFLRVADPSSGSAASPRAGGCLGFHRETPRIAEFLHTPAYRTASGRARADDPREPGRSGQPRPRYAHRRADARAWRQPHLHYGRGLPPLLVPNRDCAVRRERAVGAPFPRKREPTGRNGVMQRSPLGEGKGEGGA